MFILNCNGNFSFIFNILRYLYKALVLIVPTVLIVLVIIDVFKVVINADEKTKREAGSKIAKRLIYAVVLFLVPALISLLFKAFDNNAPSDYDSNESSYSEDWKDCFRYIFM